MRKRLRLVEADMKVFMTKKEKALKKRLIALLKDDGQGHKHAKYAARLAEYDIQIVPLKKSPDFTAAISFDEGIIYISEGFLNDPTTFSQLNVLLRHELAHNLMLHQIRMMHKIGDKPWSHIKYSQSIHQLLNVIEDFEISNKRYSADDKLTVRNLWLNGQLIKGLVTEDHRGNWQNLPVEDMYDELGKEIQALHQRLRRLLKDDSNSSKRYFPNDYLDGEFVKTFIYTDKFAPSQITMPADKFVKSKAFSKYPEEVQQILLAVYEKIGKNDDEAEKAADIAVCQDKIADSNSMTPVKLTTQSGKDIAEVYTPEEKVLVMELLKNLAGNIDDSVQSGSDGQPQDGEEDEASEQNDASSDNSQNPQDGSALPKSMQNADISDLFDDDDNEQSDRSADKSGNRTDSKETEDSPSSSNGDEQSDDQNADQNSQDGDQLDDKNDPADEAGQSKQDWYKKVKAMLGNGKYSNDDIRKVFDALQD